MIKRWYVTEPLGKPKGCLVVLPGRGFPAEIMDRLGERLSLVQTLRVCLEPFDYQWYPQPNGVGDQKDAIMGLAESLPILQTKIKAIQRTWQIPSNEIALLGHSAGSVMAIQLAIHSERTFAGIVAFAGAILEPEKTTIARHKTPILLKHNQDDECFEWEERYVPMRDNLISKGYNVFMKEQSDGGHGISLEDVYLASDFLAPLLGY